MSFRALSALFLLLLAACGAGASLEISTKSLPDAYVGEAYLKQLSATGASGAQTWRLRGALPAGLTLGADGVLHGTPSSSAERTFAVQVSDAQGRLAERSFTFAVRDPVRLAVPARIDGYVGERLPAPGVASGGRAPLTWSVEAGALPDGVSLDGVSGTLAGTPSAASTREITLRVVDANGRAASAATVVAVHPPFTVVKAGWPTGPWAQFTPLD